MKKYVLTVTLNPAIDQMTISNQEKPILAAGGKGINVSRALTKLRTPTLAVGLLASQSRAQMKSLLRKENIVTDFVIVPGNVRVNKTFIHHQTFKAQRVFEEGPRINPKDLKRFEKKFFTLVDQATIVVLAGRIAKGVPADIYARLINIAQSKGVNVCLDTSGPALALGFKSRPLLIKPNHQELEELLGKKIRSVAELKKALTRVHARETSLRETSPRETSLRETSPRETSPREMSLRETSPQETSPRGAVCVLVSWGEKGLFFSDGRVIWHAQPPTVKALCGVGCGDASVAGFVAALLRGLSLKDCLRWAAAAGAANTANFIPGDIDADHWRRLRRQIKLKKL